MNPVSKHTKWLKKAAEYWSVTTDDILSRRKDSYLIYARHTYYWLCLKDNIDLYKLSKHLGKHRTTIINSLRLTKVYELKFHVDKILENDPRKTSPITPIL